MTRHAGAIVVASLWLAACGGRSTSTGAVVTPARPSILLVTLDTTRADAVGPEAVGIVTPTFNAVAARGLRFRQAYAAVPETLPSHTSMMTGLYPAGHGIHENARYVSPKVPVIAERLHQAGYQTRAFVSAFVLARRFGLARGFDVYDDRLPGGTERSARETTDAALAELAQDVRQPRFLWVHYYDAHYPYAPPEPFRTQYAKNPYLGEVASVDDQLGRLIQAFDEMTKRAGTPAAIVIAADHGEGLGEHGEAQHGTLLYQATMHVPLVIVGPGVASGVSDTPVSTRRVFHTILDWAGLGRENSLRAASSSPEVVLGEAMKPFLEYGWQPQVMSVGGSLKAIMAGKLETYDLAADPKEARNLGGGTNMPAAVRSALDDYPVPSPAAARAPDNLDEDAKRRLASLGYVSAGAAPIVRKDAPRPADMTAVMSVIEKASGLFVDGHYAEAIPLFEHVLAADPHNVDAALSLASAHSALGQNAQAIEMFQRAAAIAPDSQDVRTYLGLHYVRTREWDRAAPLLEQVVAASPDRVTAVQALATVRAEQGKAAMEAGRTPDATAAFEAARTLQPAAFAHDLDLGVLYMDARRFDEARQALDRVPASSADYPMALFKRAEVSVLLHETDAAARIDAARAHADRTTRPLLARDRLFGSVQKH